MIRRAIAPIALFALVPSIALPAPDRTPVPLARTLNGPARETYERGRAFFRAGDFSRALGAFEDASRASSDPRLLWNIAACERKLGHNARVLALLERYLAASSLTSAERAEAERAMSAIQALVGHVEIDSEPEGAAVLVDGVPAGRTPIAALALDPGAHEIHLSLEGHREASLTIALAADERARLGKTLEPDPAPIAARDSEPEPDPEPPKAAALAPQAVEIAERPRSSGSPIAPIILAGGGVLAIGIGVVAALLSARRYDTLSGSCAPSCPPDQVGGPRTTERVGLVLIGAGGLSAAVGLSWWLLTSGEEGS
jgi:tetratricopeptide (TPR) repeat protein